MPAIATTVIVLAILAGMNPIEEHYRAGRQRHDLRVVARHGLLTTERLRILAGPCAGKLRQIVIRQGDSDDRDEITLCLVHVDRGALDALTERLRRHEAVESVEAIERQTMGGDPDA